LLLFVLSLLQEAEQMLAGVGEMGADTLHAALTKFGVVAPDTKNPISSPFPFNLMFKTSIGPRGDLVGYLRPETAQVSSCWQVLLARPDLAISKQQAATWPAAAGQLQIHVNVTS
jgi:hypothetical protein